MAYANREYADMHFVYGLCDGNALAAQRTYRLRFPERKIPSSQVFTRLHQRLVESGSFQKQRNEVGPAQNIAVEEDILDRVNESPEISSRQVANEMGTSHTNVLRVLRKNNYHPYHYTKVQGLEPGDDARRIEFCRWLLNSDIIQYQFFKKILWTDEALFTRQGVFNTHNMHLWATENPKAAWETSFQRRFTIHVWAGVIGDQFVGPHIFEGNLNGPMYLNFLRNELPQLLEAVEEGRREGIIFQQDGAPPHFSLDVRRWLNATYTTWIGRGGVVAWPARSPDLSPMDFFVWGYMKSLVYASPVRTEQELLNRIMAAAVKVREKLSFKVTVGAMRKRARCCIRQNGGHFENKLE